MSDEELVKRIRQGDTAAGEELIDRYYGAVFRYCRGHCGDRETAEDLTQETFLRLFRSLAGYSEEGKFRAWLFLIAKRLCINEGKKVPTYPLEGEESLPSPRNDMARTDDQDELRLLIEGLPPEQREAVYLRFGMGLSYRDIARATGCKLRTAQSRVAYALRNMRKRMRHE